MLRSPLLCSPRLRLPLLTAPLLLLTTTALAATPAHEAPPAARHATTSKAVRPGKAVSKPAKTEEATEEQNHHHWSYAGPETGPNAWGRLNPAFGTCDSGKEQSPINITRTSPQALEKIRFSYGLSRLQIINNGHTIQANIEPGSQIEALGEVYTLKQFHFHTPSEEQINGKSFALVAHLVHQAENGKLAVVAVLFKTGREHPLIDTLWDRMPSEHNETRTFSDRFISPASLLPEKLGYYTFAGSLTTPPCSEGVRWLVLKTPVEISAAQLARFRKEFPMNARPVQAINERVVVESQ